MIKSYVTLYFDFFEPRNAVVPLIILLISCDTDVSASCNTLSNNSSCTAFQTFQPKECNGTIDNTIGIMPIIVPMVSLDQKSHNACHFDHLAVRNVVVPMVMLSTFHDADTNALESHHQHQCQWHHVMPMLMPM